MDGLDLEIQRKRKELLIVSRSISNLLDLAMLHGSQTAASRQLEEEKRKPGLRPSLTFRKTQYSQSESAPKAT